MAESQVAYLTLVELAQRCKASAKGLPAQVDLKPQWSGVGFLLLGKLFVAPMGEFTEMLEVPPYTQLPGVQTWVKGVANVRGRLLPIFDLAVFFGEHIASHKKIQRILVLETGNIYAGLLVDQVFGMQHFPVDDYRVEVEELPETVKPFVDGRYEQGDKSWTVMHLTKFAETGRFLNAAQE